MKGGREQQQFLILGGKLLFAACRKPYCCSDLIGFDLKKISRTCFIKRSRKYLVCSVRDNLGFTSP